MIQLSRAFSPDDEKNAKLAKFKLARAAKWSLRSGKSLLDMGDLATYLLALNRREEAVEIGEFVSQNVQFAGNYDIWTPAAYAITVGARAARLLGQDERSARI